MHIRTKCVATVEFDYWKTMTATEIIRECFKLVDNSLEVESNTYSGFLIIIEGDNRDDVVKSAEAVENYVLSIGAELR